MAKGKNDAIRITIDEDGNGDTVIDVERMMGEGGPGHDIDDFGTRRYQDVPTSQDDGDPVRPVETIDGVPVALDDDDDEDASETTESDAGEKSDPEFSGWRIDDARADGDRLLEGIASVTAPLELSMRALAAHISDAQVGKFETIARLGGVARYVGASCEAAYFFAKQLTSHTAKMEYDAASLQTAEKQVERFVDEIYGAVDKKKRMTQKRGYALISRAINGDES